MIELQKETQADGTVIFWVLTKNADGLRDKAKSFPDEHMANEYFNDLCKRAVQPKKETLKTFNL